MDIPWYQDGLRFKCTGCGQCCTGSPGYVWVSAEEIKSLAELLKISEEDFVKKYTRRIGNRISLKEHSKTFDCVFLKDKKCLVYTDRPKQCQTYPWWPENIKNRAAWLEEGVRCEGINHADADLIPLCEIKKNLDK
ncbi:MAG: YkgJ family cysteine cluster protein [Verrucomicrobia bacterium]|nr:YkgJ family cysteine cluster protein [Verrucomicrobiota bacterium]